MCEIIGGSADSLFLSLAAQYSHLKMDVGLPLTSSGLETR